MKLNTHVSTSNRTAHVLGWVTVVLSLMVALLGAAPFTPAIFLIALLLPAASFVAWHGAVAAGLLSFLFCIAALVLSPFPMAPLANSLAALLWLVFCVVAVVMSLIHGVRANRARRANASAGG